jgi:hypothetical protein
MSKLLERVALAAAMLMTLVAVAMMLVVTIGFLWSLWH